MSKLSYNFNVLEDKKLNRLSSAHVYYLFTYVLLKITFPITAKTLNLSNVNSSLFLNHAKNSNGYY